jgi:cellobiose-specific phosphotransferase system component IIC
MRRVLTTKKIVTRLIFSQINRVLASLEKLFSSEHLRSFRQAMIWTLPCAMMSAIFVAIASILDVLHFQLGLAQVLKQLNTVVWTSPISVDI